MEWAFGILALILVFRYSRKRRIRTWEQKRARLRKWIRKTQWIEPDVTGPRNRYYKDWK